MIDIPSGYDWYDGSKLDDRKSVKTRRPRRSQRWRHIGCRRVRVMKKLDQSKVEYIVAEKRKGTKNHTIAESMGITVRYVQKLWARFKNTPKEKIVFPSPMGRPLRGTPTRSEQSAVLTARRTIRSGASRIWDRLRMSNMVIPQGRHTRHTAGVRRRGAAQKKAGAPQVGAIRALALQLHVAYGLQAAGRRALAGIILG